MTSRLVGHPWAGQGLLLREQVILRSPSSLPTPSKLSFKTREGNFCIPGLCGWKHRQMAAEFAAQQTQEVPNTGGSEQPRTSSLPSQVWGAARAALPG